MSSDAARPRVVLVGLGPTATDAFAALHPRFAVVCLIRPERDGLAAWAKDAGSSVVTDASPPSLDRVVGRVRPDCVVVSSYHRIIPSPLLTRCPFINVHYAPLPRYRGRATVNWAVINGEPETAITIHTMAPGLDAGRILRQEAIAIGPTDTVTELYRRLNERQRALLGDAVADVLAGVDGLAQDESGATYCCTRVPDDGEIDWAAPTRQIDRLVRALTDPYPGAFTYLDVRRLWVRGAAPVLDAPRYVGRIPGRVIRIDADTSHVDVLTGDGVYRLYEVSVGEHGAPVPAGTIIRSTRETLGLQPSVLLSRINALERELAELRARPT